MKTTILLLSLTLSVLILLQTDTCSAVEFSLGGGKDGVKFGVADKKWSGEVKFKKGEKPDWNVKIHD